MDNFKDINDKNKETMSIQNLSAYKLIGKGGDGTVYQLTAKSCIKIFAEEETQKKELIALQKGQSSPVIPRLYAYGPNYIVMEYVDGPSLKKYLKQKEYLPESIVEKVLYMLDELKTVGFTRHDTEIRHILFNTSGEIKVIDHKRALTTDRTVPTKLLTGLKKIGFLDEFMRHAKNLRPSLVEEWEETMSD